MHPTHKLAIAAVLAALVGAAGAQPVSPAGVWRTVDDSSKKDKSLVRIVESNGANLKRFAELFGN